MRVLSVYTYDMKLSSVFRVIYSFYYNNYDYIHIKLLTILC